MVKSTAELKRKLRDLKRLEINLRFNGDVESAQGNLVWETFFSLKPNRSSNNRYQIQDLLNMEREKFKEVLNEFFYHMYFRIYQENGLAAKNLYDPSLMEFLELPLDSSDKDLKSKFRDLARKYHPDLGGDPDKFIEMMEVFNRLKGDS
jgi:hypothetical protein